MTVFTHLLPSLQATLAEKSLVTPTEIQSRVVPLMLARKSVVGVSQTGSGKTLAYALPLLHMLKTLEDEGSRVTESGKPRAAIVVPTRELGEQVSRVFKLFTHTTRLRVRTVLGGTKMDVAKTNVSGSFEVLVATPGRLIKLLERKQIDLSDVRTLVFDEADQMLDPGFLPDAKRIVGACPPERQLGLFSATVSPPVQALMAELFANAEVIRSARSEQVVDSLKTINRTAPDGDRIPLLKHVLAEPATGGTLLFANTRQQCDALAAEIQNLGYQCAIYRGEMDKIERRKNLKSFRDGDISFLVATDLGSRGLDIDHVGRVVNYHLPQEMEIYLHRVGRTARAGRAGTVINFVTDRDESLMGQLAGRPPLPKKAKPRPAGRAPRRFGSNPSRPRK